MVYMAEKICIDTDIIIAILKKDPQALQFIKRMTEKELYITTITVFELLLRSTHLDIVKEFIETLNILPFDTSASVKASEIYKELKEKGNLIDMRDIFIAATAITNHCTLATNNIKDFVRIKEVKVWKE